VGWFFYLDHSSRGQQKTQALRGAMYALDYKEMAQWAQHRHVIDGFV